MRRPAAALFAGIWALLFAPGAPAQATFEIPSTTANPGIFRPEKPPEEPKEQGPVQLVYDGTPLKLPTNCRPENFLLAGEVCGEDTPCDLLLELVAVTNIYDRVLAIGNLHTNAATIASVLVRSDDAGKTWLEAAERVGAAGLEMIQMLDDQHGWIGGQQATQDHSHTPFLLITSDGGKNWVRRPIWSGDEDRNGAVLEIYFDDPQHGHLIIDRLTSDGDPYELYESLNGGLSWTIREISSEKPQIRRRLTPEPVTETWRLRESSESQGFEIQRLVSGEWSKAAEFAATIGSCRSMEAEVPFHVNRPQ
jgi:hypothetical protein